MRMKRFDLKSCRSMDLKSGGIWLNNSLPFNITDNNIVLKLNCSSHYLSVTTKCTGFPCCSPTAGGFKTAYRIDISEKDDCTSQESFVGLDRSLTVSKWMQPRLEIQWEPPQEPSCMQMSNCRDIGNATCLPDAARAS
ncbi:wall-associated receptor kinase-like 15 [Silene latifolia]|uniref:wall-associated receptor kinase-like 15 n=1 Tax=Silene latifolia TaxID=37657 RepID=UPI003D787DCB